MSGPPPVPAINYARICGKLLRARGRESIVSGRRLTVALIQLLPRACRAGDDPLRPLFSGAALPPVRRALLYRDIDAHGRAYTPSRTMEAIKTVRECRSIGRRERGRSAGERLPARAFKDPRRSSGDLRRVFRHSGTRPPPAGYPHCAGSFIILISPGHVKIRLDFLLDVR